MTKRNRRLPRGASCSWARSPLVPWLAGIAIVGALLMSLIFDDMGIARYLHMKQSVERLAQDVQHLKQANAHLQTEIDRIRQDPLRVEELARERLGFVKPGETVYQVIKPKASEPAQDLKGS